MSRQVWHDVLLTVDGGPLAPRQREGHENNHVQRRELAHTLVYEPIRQGGDPDIDERGGLFRGQDGREHLGGCEKRKICAAHRLARLGEVAGASSAARIAIA